MINYLKKCEIIEKPIDYELKIIHLQLCLKKGMIKNLNYYFLIDIF